MFWYFYSDQLQYLILTVNFFAFFVLFLYAIHLYRVEKRIKDQASRLENDAESIIEDANHKALEIITKSHYLSDSMKKEIRNNFEDILKDLKEENRKFYEELETKYVSTSRNFVDRITHEEETKLAKFSKDLAEKATKAEEKIEATLEKNYEEAHKQIDEYKERKKEEFETEIRQRIAKIARELLPQYIRQEDQEKIAQEAIEKAYSEGFFGK